MFVYIMAAKGEQVLVAACLALLFLHNCSFILCQTPTSTITTTVPLTTTINVTETTTTTPTTTPAPTTTTQAPTTTTTALPTLPPTQVASVTELSPCPCDLTGNGCDINCCCDLDCTADDRAVFTNCLPNSGNVDDRLCLKQDILLLENAPFPKNYTQDGLFCIYFDNYNKRNYYSIPNLVTDLTTFNNYVSTYGGPSFSTTQNGQSAISNHYRYGDPVYIVYSTLATGTLGLPKALGSTACSSASPVAYLKNEKTTCVRPVTTLTQTTCEGTRAFNARSYYTGFRVVTTPYLFIYIVNGTAITTTPRTTVTTTTPIVTTDNSTNVTIPTTTRSTTTVTLTTGINTNITTTVTTVTTEAPTTAPPQQINLYNNSYTTDIGLTTVECRDTNYNIITCPFTAGTVGTPTFTSATSTCNNVVKEVEYRIIHDGTAGIMSVNVSFVLQSITTSNLPLPQIYRSIFTGVNDINTTETSGNPGYVVGKPVRAGIRYINESFGNRNIIVENSYNLTVVKSSATGTCLTDANNRVQVNFGQEIRSGCLIRFNLNTVTVADHCTAMQEVIQVALEGSSDFINVIPQFNRYVATFGNSALEQTGDWVPVLQDGPRTTTAPAQGVDGATCQLSMGMHIQIVYSNVGSVANPQAKILGVAFNYEDQQTITYTCSGTTCQPGNANVDQSFEISQSVSFIDVSEPATGAVGQAPIFIAKVPNDFFYPFATGAGSSTKNSLLTISIITVLCTFSRLFVNV